MERTGSNSLRSRPNCPHVEITTYSVCLGEGTAALGLCDLPSYSHLFIADIGLNVIKRVFKAMFTLYRIVDRAL